MFALFRDLIYRVLFSGGDSTLAGYTVNLFNNAINFDVYISELLALICTIVVYVCCCLVVLKIIKTVANVFRG